MDRQHNDADQMDEKERRQKGLATVEEAIEEYRRGRFVIIIDDEERENEGDLTLSAQFADAEAINFMAKYARGLICMPMTVERVSRLGIPMMVGRNDDHFGTPFTNAPVVVVSSAGLGHIDVQSTTTQATISGGTTTSGGEKIHVHVRGY